jgi:hypothetical protein
MIIFILDHRYVLNLPTQKKHHLLRDGAFFVLVVSK